MTTTISNLGFNISDSVNITHNLGNNITFGNQTFIESNGSVLSTIHHNGNHSHNLTDTTVASKNGTIRMPATVPYQHIPGHPPNLPREHIFPVRLPVESWDRTLSNVKSHSNHSDGGAIICIVFVVAFYVFAVLLLMTSHCRRSRDHHLLDNEGVETVPTLPLLQNQHLGIGGSTNAINDHSTIYDQMESGCSSYQRTNSAQLITDESFHSASGTSNNGGMQQGVRDHTHVANGATCNADGIVLRKDILQRIRQILRTVTSHRHRRDDDVDSASQGMMTAGVFQTHIV